MRRLLIIATLALVPLGCEGGPGKAKPTPSSAASSTADAKLAAAKIKVPEQYRQQAQQDINGDNVDEEIDALENEILADAKKK